MAGFLSPLKKMLRPFRPALESAGIVRPPSYARLELDLKLLAYVSHRDGVFVEAGANDGMSESNTYYFERNLGWSGLLVEPVPQLAAEARRNRPTAIVEQCALVAKGDPRETVDINSAGLFSFIPGARGSQAADDAHLSFAAQYLPDGESPRMVSVPTATLGDLLRRHGFERVDLLSLDVEGFEPQALAGLDFDNLAPTWILVEANDPDAVEAVLAPRYRHVADLSHYDKLYTLR